jgi:BirA family transcriptional regulator, biotin operon repressor / biotin---[acetyl-CoA-carboxylase] ligase
MTKLPALPEFFSLRHYAEIDSTNSEARRLAVSGAPSGLVVWADRQSAGHGRQGRAWQSPPGNLYCSILLRPEASAAETAQLSFASALAVCDAIPGDLAPRCKWPNDVLIGGKKVAGILLESEGVGGKIAALIVGIGVNIASHPPDTEMPATSLGPAVTPATMLAAICRHFLSWHDIWRTQGFTPLREAWLARAHGLGSDIRVRYGTTETLGRFVDLDASGALVLENSEGRRHIAAGAVFPTAG